MSDIDLAAERQRLRDRTADLNRRVSDRALDDAITLKRRKKHSEIAREMLAGQGDAVEG